MKPQLIITGVSGSGKSTIMRNLLNTYPDIYGKPIQYTTRQPRYDGELDDYVFLTHRQFMKKLLNGDFIEYVEYNGELYAVSVYFNPDKVNVFIAEPVGRESLKRYFNINKIPYVATYIKVDEVEIKSRLERRGMTIQQLESRMKDFDYFKSSEGDKIIQGIHKEQQVMDSIHNYVEGALSKT